MRNYLIIVEGAHDIAVLVKLLKLNGIDKEVKQQKDLPEMWKHTIPAKFPFHHDILDRITPIPSFVKNSDVSVAIKNAGSDLEIMDVLYQTLHIMEVKDVDQINGIMLICDADNLIAAEKRKKLLTLGKEYENFALDKDSMVLDVKIKKIPLYTFIFPDNHSKGNLENLLLQTAEVVYPGLLGLTTEYVENASVNYKNLKKEQNAKKAKVGCIANVMKPGKANQVSILDNDWISDKTLKECNMLHMLNESIKSMIEEESDNY